MMCHKCSAETKLATPRNGWKRHQERIWCPACWKKTWCLKAITIPVVRPLGDGVGWPELRTALKEAWVDTTAATNWLVSQLWSRDTQRMPGSENIEKMPKTYLYPELRVKFPRLPSQACAALEQSVTARYRSRRFATLWMCEQSLPNAKYPQPAIVPNAAWSAKYVPAGKDGGDLVPSVTVTLTVGQRFTLQLRGGREWQRQLADFRKMSGGTAVLGQLQIVQKRANGGNGVTERDGGGQKVRSQVMVKMVAWFPRTDRSNDRVLHCRTDAEQFALALDETNQKIRNWHCDHVRRWIAEHRKRLQAWSDDQKCENRPIASFQSRREAACAKFRDRIESHQKEFVAQLVGVALRNRYGAIRFDDSIRDYFGDQYFWSGLRTKLAAKCNEKGIAVTFASGEAVEQSADSLAMEELAQ